MRQNAYENANRWKTEANYAPPSAADEWAPVCLWAFVFAIEKRRWNDAERFTFCRSKILLFDIIFPEKKKRLFLCVCCSVDWIQWEHWCNGRVYANTYHLFISTTIWSLLRNVFVSLAHSLPVNRLKIFNNNKNVDWKVARAQGNSKQYETYTHTTPAVTDTLAMQLMNSQSIWQTNEKHRSRLRFAPFMEFYLWCLFHCTQWRWVILFIAKLIISRFYAELK